MEAPGREHRGGPLGAAAWAASRALVARYPRLRFLACTSGNAAIDARTLAELRAPANLSLLFSFEGLEASHDAIRGAGSFGQVLALLERYNGDGRRLAGASITLRRDGWREATSPELLRLLARAGCSYALFDPLFPSGREASLAPADYAEAIARVATLAAELPLQCFVNPFGQISASGCEPSRRSRMLSVDYRGNLYVSRRSEPLGTLERGAPLEAIDEAAFRACRAEGGEPRRALFEDTGRLLGAVG